MIDFEQAKEIATVYINKGITDNVLVLTSNPIVKDYGWIFLYNSKRYLETGDFSYAITGNIPILVDKMGAVHNSGISTAYNLEHHVKKFDAVYGDK